MPTTTRERSLVLAVIVSAALALTGCTADDPPAGSGPDSGSARASVNGYPGLYYDDSVVSVLPSSSDQLRLTGSMACADMDAMLSAGQWSVVDRITLPEGTAGIASLGGVVPGLLLRRGSDLAFVAFKGVGNSCTATVTRVQRDGIAITGQGFPGTAEGWAATTSCIRLDADKLNVGIYFDTTANVGGLVNAPLVSKDGTYSVNGASDDLGVSVLRHTTHVLEVFGTVFMTGGTVEGVTPHIFKPGESFAGTAKVEVGEADRPRGTITMTGLLDPESGIEVSLTMPFSCPTVKVIATG